MSEPISASRYWVLRGSFGPGLDVAWASVSVLHQGGPIDGRLVGDPSAFAIGLPSAIGAPPERTTTTVEIDNADGALDPWIVGATATALEYSAPNFLTFEGQIFRGTIAADGTCTEEAFTPPLVASGPVDADRSKGTITLALAHNDRPMLGPVEKIFTLKEIAEGEVVSALMTPPLDDATTLDDIWALFTQTSAENIDAATPWLYGPVTVPLVRVSPDGQYPAVFVAGMAWEKHAIDFTVDRRAAIVAKRLSAYQEVTRSLSDPVVSALKVDVDTPAGTRRIHVAIAVQMKPSPDKAEKYWWSSAHPNGMPGVGAACTPASILREIITDHSEAGAACLHAASWAAAEAQLAREMPQGCAGAIDSSTTIAEIVEYIAPTGNLGLWVGPDGLLHAATGGWGLGDRDAAAGTLPELIEPDVFPGDDSGAAMWSEAVPSDPEDRGAALTKVSVQWTEEQRELFPVAIVSGSAPRRVPLQVDAEWMPEGAWINPRAAKTVVRAMASRGAYPTRRPHFATHADRALNTMEMLRVSHPWGITAEPPYQRRLLRLERAEVQPAEHAALVTLEDLGPSERIRLGLLDSIENWVAVDPTKPKPATLTLQTDGVAKSSEDVFKSDMVGATIWAHGASSPENRRSYRINKVSDGKTAEVDDPPSATEVIAPLTPTLATASWLVMWTHESKGAGHRPDYIRGSHLPDGALAGGDSGYQFAGR